MTSAEFQLVLDRLATGWRAKDYAAVASEFSADVEYGDPTRYMLTGRVALLEFFRADDDKDQFVTWHLSLFDQAQQTGVLEYTYEGTNRYHGVALVRVGVGGITHWREYQHVDVRTWDQFAGGTVFPEQR
jgi:hypothetical protein